MKNTLRKLWVLWLICWVIYCGSEFLLYLLIYRKTMPQQRDFSVLFLTQQAVLAITYTLVFSPTLCTSDLDDGFGLWRVTGEFFHGNWLQILLLAVCAILYEGIQWAFPHSDNLISAFLLMLFPSTALIRPPILRTMIGAAVSIISVLLTHILFRYGRYRRQRKPKNSLDD